MQPQGSCVSDGDQVWKLLERSEKKCVFKSQLINEKILLKEIIRISEMSQVFFYISSQGRRDGLILNARQPANNYENSASKK